jgi:hypothetical protein
MYETGVGLQTHLPGPYISINSLVERRLDTNVTTFRNFLIEMDQPGLSAADQLALAANLPYSTATWSGSKSVHFIVSLVDPVDENTWRRWASGLIASIPGSDRSTKNPSRFTRLPDQIRADTGQEQALLAVRGRVATSVVAAYVEPHLEPEVTDYRKMYNNFRGLTGLAAAHPMTKAFLNQTHPCNQGRNNALFKSAKDLKDCGLQPDEIESLLIPAALEIGLVAREINQTIKSALRK